MPSKITLKLINDERKERRLLSAKACSLNYTDIEDCSSGFTTDSCKGRDFTSCVNSYDYCKYIDGESCQSWHGFDYCEYDYVSECSSSDICTIDRETV